MSTKQKTLERLDKLDEQLDQLFQVLSAMPEAELNRQPDPGRWTALNNLQHLRLSEGLSQRYIRKKLDNTPVDQLPSLGITQAYRRALLEAWSGLPIKTKAPKFVNEDHFTQGESLKAIQAGWKEERRQLRTYLEQQPEEVFRKAAYKHPFAGRISFEGMLRFFELHFKRHREQLFRALG